MTRANFLAVKAVISLVFGILLALVPVALMSVFGATLDPTGAVMGRFVGATLIGIGLICWFARTAADSELREAILLSLFIGDAIGFLAALMGQLSNLMGALGWIVVLIWLLLALGLGYFRFMKPVTP